MGHWSIVIRFCGVFFLGARQKKLVGARARRAYLKTTLFTFRLDSIVDASLRSTLIIIFVFLPILDTIPEYWSWSGSRPTNISYKSQSSTLCSQRSRWCRSGQPLQSLTLNFISIFAYYVLVANNILRLEVPKSGPLPSIDVVNRNRVIIMNLLGKYHLVLSPILVLYRCITVHSC